MSQIKKKLKILSNRPIIDINFLKYYNATNNNKKNMKKAALSSLAIAVALTCATKVIANEYTVIINPDKNSIKFVNQEWRKIESLFIKWVDVDESSEDYRFNCLNWTPAPETIVKGEPFIQTSNECSGKQVAQFVRQEQNINTGLIRQTEEYIDTSKEQILNELTDTREAVGTKISSLQIIDPVAGRNGIYQISDGKGGTVPAYVNMIDDGGKWILVARWVTSPYTALTWNEFGVKGNTIKTYSNDQVNYPVLPQNIINTSSRMMFKGGSAAWISLFGNWQSFDMFEQNSYITNAGFSVNTSIGSKTMYIRANGWPTTYTPNMSSAMGLHTQYGNSGPCGGESKVGSNPICITLGGNSTSHFDTKNIKEFYIKANN